MGVYNNVGLCVPQIIGTIQRFLDIEVVYVVVLLCLVYVVLFVVLCQLKPPQHNYTSAW